MSDNFAALMDRVQAKVDAKDPFASMLDRVQQRYENRPDAGDYLHQAGASLAKGALGATRDLFAVGETVGAAGAGLVGPRTQEFVRDVAKFTPQHWIAEGLSAAADAIHDDPEVQGAEPGVAKWLSTTGAGALGQAAPFIATAGLGAAAGLTARGATGLVALTGMGTNAVQGYEDAVNNGATPTQAFGSMLVNGGLGVLEAAEPALILARWDKRTGGMLSKTLLGAFRIDGEKGLLRAARVLGEASTEAATETIQQGGGNLYAGLTYDEKREITDGLADAAGGGGFAGAVLSLLTGGHHGTMAQQEAAGGPVDLSQPVSNADTLAGEPNAARPLAGDTPPSTSGGEALSNSPESPDSSAALLSAANGRPVRSVPFDEQNPEHTWVREHFAQIGVTPELVAAEDGKPLDVHGAALPGRVAIDANAPLRSVALHETVHQLGAEADRLADDLRKLDPEGSAKFEAFYAREYERATGSRYDAGKLGEEGVAYRAELNAGLVYEALQRPERLRAMLESKPGAWTRIVDAVVRALQKVGVGLRTSKQRALDALRREVAGQDASKALDSETAIRVALRIRDAFETLQPQAASASGSPSPATEPATSNLPEIPDGSIEQPRAVVVDSNLLSRSLRETKDAPAVARSYMEEDAAGVVVGQPTALDKAIQAGRVNEKELRDAFSDTREHLRKTYGETVTLYRTEPPSKNLHKDTRLVFMGDESLAKKFEREDRKAALYTVSVDDILAVYTTDSGYYEFIVKAQPRASTEVGGSPETTTQLAGSETPRPSDDAAVTERATAGEASIEEPEVAERVREERAPTEEPSVEEAIPVLATAPDRVGPERLASLKHEATEGLRAMVGTDPYTGRAPKKDAEIYARQVANIRSDPHAGARLVDELSESGRIPNDDEKMLLGLELNRLRVETELAEPGPAKDAAVKAIKRAMDITDALASEGGASLRAQRWMIAMDYSYAGMESKLREAKGEDLSPEDKALIENVRERLTKAEKDVDTLRRAEEERNAREQFETLKKEVQARPRSRPRDVRRQEIRTRLDEIVREFAAPTASANPFADPVKYARIVEAAKLAIEYGITKAADFVEDFAKRAGDHIRPYAADLQRAFDDATKAHGEELVAPIRERLKAGEAPGRYMSDLARYFVSQGVTEREALIDAVHKLLPEMKREQVRDAISGYGQYKAASKEEVDVKLRQLKSEMQKVSQIEALEKKIAPLKTGFERGEPSEEYRRLTKRANELRKQAGIKVDNPERALKTARDQRETSLKNQIADLSHEIATKKLVARTKGEPVTSPEIERLTKERDALKAEHDAIFNAPPKTQSERDVEHLTREVAELDRRIKSGETAPRGPKQGPDVEAVAKLKAERDALNERIAEMRKGPKRDTEVEALHKQVAELTRKIAEGDIEVRRKQGPDRAEVAALKAEREKLNEQLKELRKPSDDERAAREVASSIKALEKTLAGYQKRIAEGDLSTSGAKQGPDRAEIAAVKAKIAVAQAELDALRAAANPKATPEERATKNYIARKTREAERLRAREAYGDFEPREKVERKLSDKETEALAEQQRAKRSFERAKAKYEYENRTTAKKIRDAALQPLKEIKTLKSSIDVSAVGRQGFLHSVGDLVFDPVGLTKRMGRMFRAFASEPFADRVRAEMENHPAYEQSRRDGVEYTGYGDPLTPHEEYYESKWVKYIPGVKGSERAFTTYMNLLRFEHYRRIVAATDATPDARKQVANLVNVFSGRGATGKGKLKSAVDGAGAVLWAPRLYLSRFQVIAGQPLYRGAARRQMVREYGRALVGIAAVYGLVQLYKQMDPDEDISVSLDPTSPDGGKIKIGDTRVDPLAGLQQSTRLVARTVTGIGQAAAGDKSEEDLAKVFADFLRTKVSPSISVPYELATGRNLAFGREVDRGESARDALLPLSFGDIMDAMESQGVAKGAALGALSLFGVGVNTYADKKRPSRSRTEIAR